MAKRFAFRVLMALVLLTFTSTFGCSTWKPMPVTDAEITADEAETLVGEKVKFYTDDGEQSMKVKKVDYPYIEGTKKQRHDERIQIRVDLREVQRVEVQEFQGGRTALMLLGSFVVLGIIALGGIIADDTPMLD